MGLFEQLPYSNFHELNLGWIVEQVKKVSLKVDDLDEYIMKNIKDEIRAALDDLFINAMYDADTETLILVLEVRDNG